MSNIDWKRDDAEAHAYWSIKQALEKDYAMQMLSEDAHKGLSGAIAQWLTQDTPNRTAAFYGMPKMLETTPFAIFGDGMAKRVTQIAVDACWPEQKEASDG